MADWGQAVEPIMLGASDALTTASARWVRLPSVFKVKLRSWIELPDPTWMEEMRPDGADVLWFSQ